MSDKSTNPKDKLGIKKVQLDKVPDTSIIYQALAMEDGALKYGPYNFRESNVAASIYVAAAKRHLALWFNGEELTEDTGIPNLGAVLACIGIIIDAQIAGTLVDDRPKPIDAVKLNNLLKKVKPKEPEVTKLCDCYACNDIRSSNACVKNRPNVG